jgi:hypothetical protein
MIARENHRRPGLKPGAKSSHSREIHKAQGRTDELHEWKQQKREVRTDGPNELKTQPHRTRQGNSSRKTKSTALRSEWGKSQVHRKMDSTKRCNTSFSIVNLTSLTSNPWRSPLSLPLLIRMKNSF